jgi:predicted lactoylglutathione lyase
MARSIYVSLPVADLDRAVAFFTAVGFTFNPEFASDDATCMIVDQRIFVMLLTEERFATYTPKPVADARAGTEVMVCLQLERRADVDDMVQRAVEAGGRTYREPEDHGFMYGHGFEDPDGHIWELIHMQPEE